MSLRSEIRVDLRFLHDLGRDFLPFINGLFMADLVSDFRRESMVFDRIKRLRHCAY